MVQTFDKRGDEARDGFGGRVHGVGVMPRENAAGDFQRCRKLDALDFAEAREALRHQFLRGGLGEFA